MTAASTSMVEVCSSNLAFLFYELVNSTGDQEGFLIGDVTTKVTDKISDSQLNYAQEEVIISIRCSIPCERAGSFYNGQGKIDELALTRLLGSQFKDLIGWYRFRRNTTLDVFAREKVIHRNIVKLLPKSRQAFFVFGIFSCTATQNLSTHNLDHIFLRHNNGLFEGIPLRIVNLGDTSQSNYRKNPSLALDREKGFYGHLINSTKRSNLNAEGTSVNQIQSLNVYLHDGLRKVSKKVSESEETIARLEKELKALRMTLKAASDSREKNSSIAELKSGLEKVRIASNESSSRRAVPPDMKSGIKSPPCETQKNLEKISMASDLKLNTPKDVSRAEHTLRKVQRPHSPFTADVSKVQVIHIEDSPKKLPRITNTGTKDSSQDRSQSPVY